MAYLDHLLFFAMFFVVDRPPFLQFVICLVPLVLISCVTRVIFVFPSICPNKRKENQGLTV